MVRITDSDGAVGVGYSYTIGQGDPAVMSLLADTLAPQLIGQDAENIGRLWRSLMFSTHAGRAYPSDVPSLGIDWDWTEIDKRRLGLLTTIIN